MMKSESSADPVDAAHYRMRLIDDLSDVPEADWRGLQAATTPGSQNPFVDLRFLRALADSGSTGEGTGWEPRFLLLEQGDSLVGAVPLYEKHHSYGEYVFDWAWADAYQRNRLAYYPKGLVAVPFTPVPGPRLFAVDAPARAALAGALVVAARRLDWSSVHVLFPDAADATALASHSRVTNSCWPMMPLSGALILY